MESDRYHVPVLADQVVELLMPIRDGIVVDATFGGGGHSRRLIEALGEGVTLVGIDRDPDARAQAAALGIDVLAGDFGDIGVLLDDAEISDVAAVLFDFGVSSHQIDVPERGFSYHADGPLDMRMDRTTGVTAAEIVNEAERSHLIDVIRRYGEEPMAVRIADAIISNRPIMRTGDLARVVAAAVPAARRRRRHPARKTFQALRIAVNDELSSIERGLDGALDRLELGGRCLAISYHSLEDRIVKRRFAAGTAGCSCPPDLPVCACGAGGSLKLLTPSSVTPTQAEIAANPRARSARLRACEKVAA